MWGKSRALRGIICHPAAVFCKKYKVSHNSHFMYTIMLVGENVLAYPQTNFTLAPRASLVWVVLFCVRKGEYI